MSPARWRIRFATALLTASFKLQKRRKVSNKISMKVLSLISDLDRCYSLCNWVEEILDSYQFKLLILKYQRDKKNRIKWMVYIRQFYAFTHSVCQDLIGPHSLLNNIIYNYLFSGLQVRISNDCIWIYDDKETHKCIDIVCEFSIYLSWYLFLFFYLCVCMCVWVWIYAMCLLVSYM